MLVLGCIVSMLALQRACPSALTLLKMLTASNSACTVRAMLVHEYSLVEPVWLLWSLGDTIPPDKAAAVTLQTQDENTSSQEHLSPSERSDAAHSGDSFYTAQVGSMHLHAVFFADTLMLCCASLGWVWLSWNCLHAYH